MTDLNYDEFTNSIIYPSDQTWSRSRGEFFPERLSRLHIGTSSVMAAELFSPVARRHNRRSRDRYKTQPITFDEITEVDEDNSTSVGISSDSNSYTGFSMSLDEGMGGKWKLFGNSANIKVSTPTLPEDDFNSSAEFGRSPEDESIIGSGFGSQSDSLNKSKSGFSAALESAKRRRKYSKRSKRRNSDMEEEEIGATECQDDGGTGHPIPGPPAVVTR